MRLLKKHRENQESFEEGILLLAQRFKRMKVFLNKILSTLKHSKYVERKIEEVFHELAHSKVKLDNKTHLLRDFYFMLSKAKNSQSEARNILLHYNLKGNHDIIEQAFHKFRESHHYTRKASKILKQITKKHMLK